METLSFDDAMRRFIDDARWNFHHLRAGLQESSGGIVAMYDVPFTVEAAFATYISLLDYDVPVARVQLYSGDDDAAAELVMDWYCERVMQFATGPGDRTELTQPDYGDRSVTWSRMSYPTVGPPIAVVRIAAARAPDPTVELSVWVEVYGFAIECIDGSPDDSPMRIMLGDDYLR